MEDRDNEVPDFTKMKPSELPDEFTLKLRKPIEFGKGDQAEMHFELELREPMLDEIDAFTKNIKKHGEIGAMKYFIAQISGLPPPLITKLGARDMTVAQEYLMAFLRGSRTTGDTSEG
jgi:hypothetical protein